MPYTLASERLGKRPADRQLLPGKPAAHRRNRLMLLPPGPDMVHNTLLHRTQSSTPPNRHLTFRKTNLGKGIQLCYSGLQIQGTANSPLGTANCILIKSAEYYITLILRAAQVQYSYIFPKITVMLVILWFSF